MTRWLLTGAAGLLGREIQDALAGRPDIEVTATDRDEVDITDPEVVKAAVAGHDVVVNTAAWVNADTAESNEAAAAALNADAVRNLADACAGTGARLLHISTDYVFDGRARTPYSENAEPRPINAYGRGKRQGELAVLNTLPDTGYVVRTAWLYGEYGRNFPAIMLDLASKRGEVSVVNDQTGQPTWARYLARRLADLGAAAVDGRAPAGVYHGTGGGQATWFELARAVFELAGLDPERVRPTTSAEFGSPAPRPEYSVLGHERWAAAGMKPLPHWHDMLVKAFATPYFRDLVARSNAR